MPPGKLFLWACLTPSGHMPESCVAELQLLSKENVVLWKCTTEEHSMYLSRPDAMPRWLCLCLFFFFFDLQVGEFSGQQTPAVPHCS